VEQATWEDASFIQKIFPAFQPWGQVWCRQGGVVMPCDANWRTVEAWCGNKVQKSLQRSSSNQRPRSADTILRHRPHPCPLIVHPMAKNEGSALFWICTLLFFFVSQLLCSLSCSKFLLYKPTRR
jgi:hypothetical protein